jgi:hypothetical protein
MDKFQKLLDQYLGLQSELETNVEAHDMNIVRVLNDQERLILLAEETLTLRTRYHVLMHMSNAVAVQHQALVLADACMQIDSEVCFWILRLLRCEFENLSDSLKDRYRKLADLAQKNKNTRIELLALLDFVNPSDGNDQAQVNRINELIDRQRLVWITSETLDEVLANNDEILTVVDFLESTGQDELAAELTRKYIDDEDGEGPFMEIINK